MTHFNMTTTGEAPAAGDNSKNAMKDFDAAMRKYGQAEALGQASRPTAGIAIVAAAYDGLLKEGDAPHVYGEYQAGIVAVSKKNPLTPGGSSEAVQVSKFRQLIKVGMLPGVDARDLMRRVTEHVSACKAADIKINSPFDAMVSAARMQIGQPDVDLSDEQVATCVEKAEARTKEGLEKLIDAYKRDHKLSTELNIPSLHAAVQCLADAIVEAGGEVPPMTKEGKDKAAFMAQAAKYGFTVVQ